MLSESDTGTLMRHLLNFSDWSEEPNLTVERLNLMMENQYRPLPNHSHVFIDAYGNRSGEAVVFTTFSFTSADEPRKVSGIEYFVIQRDSGRILRLFRKSPYVHNVYILSTPEVLWNKYKLDSIVDVCTTNQFDDAESSLMGEIDFNQIFWGTTGRKPAN